MKHLWLFLLKLRFADKFIVSFWIQTDGTQARTQSNTISTHSKLTLNPPSVLLCSLLIHELTQG